MDTNDFLKDSFFKNTKTKLQRCWSPEGSCSSKSIKAHSIQNSRVLDLLNANGQVIMPQEKVVNKGEIPLVGLAEIGRNEASTFTGLCQKHDKEIFSPIDDSEFDINNRQQLFLLAYRSIHKKFHSLSTMAKIVNKIYEDQVRVGRAFHEPKDPSSNWAMIQFIRAHGAYLYKGLYDEAYLKQQYDIVNHDKFSFRHKRPTTAVSSLYWLSISKPNSMQVPWIVLNVVPTKDETHVIFSYTVDDKDYVSSKIKDIFNSSIKRRLWLLSKEIISSSDNFVISPDFWNGLAKKKRDVIITYYRDTLMEENPFSGDIRDLSLFELSNKK